MLKSCSRSTGHNCWNAAGQVSAGIKIFHGIGHIANYIKAILFSIFTLYFYTTVMGLSGKLVGVAMAVGLVWDAMIDPVIGMMSDNANGRHLGKRHGFMMLGSLGMGAAFWAFFNPPSNLSTSLLFSWLLLTSLLTRTLTSIFCIPYYALGAELSQNYHERTAITGFRGAFALVGAMGTAVLSFILFFPPAADGGDPKLNISGYHAMGLFAGLIMTGVGLISTLGTLSQRKYAKRGRRFENHQSLRQFLVYNLDAMKIPSFRVIFFSYSTFFLGTVINVTLATHFISYYVRITASRSLSTFHFSFYFGALIGILFWTHAGKRIEKRWAYFIGTLATAAIMNSAFWLLGEGKVFGIGNLAPLLVGHGSAGFFGSILWIIPASMVADVVDEDELRCGTRREGTFFGLFNFGEQIATGSSLLISGVLLDGFAGLIPGQVHQSSLTVARVGMLYSLLPSVLLVLAAGMILLYPLNQVKVSVIQRQLASRATGKSFESNVFSPKTKILSGTLRWKEKESSLQDSGR